MFNSLARPLELSIGTSGDLERGVVERQLYSVKLKTIPLITTHVVSCLVMTWVHICMNVQKVSLRKGVARGTGR